MWMVKHPKILRVAGERGLEHPTLPLPPSQLSATLPLPALTLHLLIIAVNASAVKPRLSRLSALVAKAKVKAACRMPQAFTIVSGAQVSVAVVTASSA